MKDQLRELVQAGFTTIPVKHKSKKPLVKWQGYITEKPSSQELKDWYSTDDPINYAILTGKASNNITVIDFDHNKETGQDAAELLEAFKVENDIAHTAPIVKTGSGGFHLYLVIKEDLKNGVKLKFKGQETSIDLRSTGGYVIGPGSIHENGKEYELMQGEFSDIPEIDTLLSLGLEHKTKPPSAMPKPSQPTPQGVETRRELAFDYIKTAPESTAGEAGHNVTYKLAIEILKGFDLPANIALEVLTEYNKEKCAPPWSQNELEHKINEATKAKTRAPGWLVLKFFNKFNKINEIMTSFIDGRYNTIKNCYEIQTEDTYQQINDRSFSKAYLKLYDMALKTGIKGAGSWASQDNFRTCMKTAFPDYDPIKQAIEDLPEWDGTDHIKQIAEFIPVKTTAEKDILRNFLKLWLVGSISQALEKERNELLLVLAGPQGTYKTSFFRWLALDPEYSFCGDIDPSNKDHKLRLCENMTVILDELDSVIKKSDIGRLKSMLSETHINERRPYAEFPERRSRRASFCGQLNDSSFLQDHTGNRRWAIMEITGNINPQYIEYDKHQVWAQAKALFEGGFDFRLSQKMIKLMSERNQKFSKVTSERQLILKHFKKTEQGEPGQKWLTATDIMKAIKFDGEDRIIHSSLKLYQVTNALKELNYTQKWKGGTINYSLANLTESDKLKEEIQDILPNEYPKDLKY